MKMSGWSEDAALAEVDLLMECVDEELLPWQQEANAQAEKVYMDVCREIDDAKRRLIENQMQRQLLMGSAPGVQQVPTVISNQTTPAFQNRPESPDVIILDDDEPSPTPPSLPPGASRQQHHLRPAPPVQHMPHFQRSPNPLILPLPGNGISGGMLLMQPTRMTKPMQFINATNSIPHKMAPLVLHPAGLPHSISGAPSQRFSGPVQQPHAPTAFPKVRLLLNRAADDVSTSPVPNTHGLGVRRPATSSPSPPPVKRKQRTPCTKDMQQTSGDWVPLDEYYYGKKEGDPAYVEEKGEYRFKCWYCNKMLYNNLRVMSHMQGHIDSEKQLNLELCDITQCKHCYKQFDTPFEMQCHIEKVHQNKSNVLVCRICEKDLDSKSVLQSHMRQCHNPCEMPYICHLCNFRSSIYSDVVDHFKKRHNSSGYILCLYCLRVFRTHFSKTSGWGFTSTYYQHLVRHQCKNNKKCRYCKLTFINKADVKAHCKSDHLANFKGILGANAGSTLTADKEQVMIQLPESAPRQTDKRTNCEPKSLNVQSVSKLRDFADLTLAVESWHTCVECKMPMNTPNHFKKYIECSMCRYATICSAAYANHMINFHSRSAQRRSDCVPRDRKMPATMYCLCGFSGSHGNSIANHLVLCSKRTCYSQKPEVHWLEHNSDKEEFAFSDGHSEEMDSSKSDVTEKDVPSLFGALGLVKKAQKQKVYKKRGPKRTIPDKTVSVLDEKPQKTKPKWMSEKAREIRASRSKYSIFDGGVRCGSHPKMKSSNSAASEVNGSTNITETRDTTKVSTSVTVKDVADVNGKSTKGSKKESMVSASSDVMDEGVLRAKDGNAVTAVLWQDKSTVDRVSKNGEESVGESVSNGDVAAGLGDEMEDSLLNSNDDTTTTTGTTTTAPAENISGDDSSKQNGSNVDAASAVEDVAGDDSAKSSCELASQGEVEGVEGVEGDEVSPRTVEGEEVSLRTVEGEEVSPRTVEGDEVSPRTMEGEEVSPRTVEGEEVSPRTVEGDEVSPRTVEGDEDSPRTVEGDEDSPRTVEGDEVSPRTVEGEEVSPRTVEGDEVSPRTVEGDEDSPRTVEGDEDSPRTVEGDEVSPRTVEGDEVSPRTVEGEDVSSRTVEGEEVSPRTVEGEEVSPRTVEGEEVSPRTVEGDKVSEALEHAQSAPREDTDSAAMPVGDYTAYDGINLISPENSPMKALACGSAGSVKTSQSNDSLALSGIETDSETRPTSVSEPLSAGDKSLVEVLSGQDVTECDKEESPLPLLQEEKSVTAVALSKSGQSCTHVNSDSQNSGHRTDCGNYDSDHRHKSSSSNPRDSPHDHQDHSKRDRHDCHHDRHHDHGRDKYSRSPRDRHNSSDRNNQRSNHRRHDNRGYYGDSGYGRENTDRRDNRQGGGRSGNPNNY